MQYKRLGENQVSADEKLSPKDMFQLKYFIPVMNVPERVYALCVIKKKAGVIYLDVIRPKVGGKAYLIKDSLVSTQK
jgi:hypothetical protein